MTAYIISGHFLTNLVIVIKARTHVPYSFLSVIFRLSPIPLKRVRSSFWPISRHSDPNFKIPFGKSAFFNGHQKSYLLQHFSRFFEADPTTKKVLFFPNNFRMKFSILVHCARPNNSAYLTQLEL